MTSDGYVLAASAAVIVAAVIILASLLSRYNRLVREADKSTRLAKDVWDSVNTRFGVVDGRIIDLMAKTDVLSSRLGLSTAAPEMAPSSSPRITKVEASVDNKFMEAAAVARPSSPIGERTDTEVRVLRLLVEGPKSSAEIKEQLGRSREHTARLMKGLFERGLVVRNDRNKPYVYEITEQGRAYVAS